MHGTIDAGIHVEARPLGELAAFADDLRALIAQARETNVFYEPAFMTASAPMFGRDVVVGLVWRGKPRRLIGFFPVQIERRRYGLPFAVLVGWTHRFGPLGAPLIDRSFSEHAVAAWLEYIATDPCLPNFLLMPFLPARCAATFETAVTERDGRCAEFDQHSRALLQPDQGRDGYLDHAAPHRKRKELRRQRRRLADRGALTSDTAYDPEAVRAALADFLQLEAAGWKGRAGTAALAREDTRRLIEQAVIGLAAEGKSSVSRLQLDGRAIAAAVTLTSGDSAWGWKIAYDEAFARYSPGVQMLHDVTQHLLDDPHIARTDSCATPDHPMIDHIWRERLVLSDRLMSVVPCSAAGFAGVRALEATRRAAIDTARRVRNRLRRNAPS